MSATKPRHHWPATAAPLKLIIAKFPVHNRPVVAVCPECQRASTLEALLAARVLPGFVQCPRCAIGTPPAEWRAA